MTKFYLVRHGEPDWDLNEKYKLRGHGNDLPALTERGIEQAKKVARNERLKGADIIIASPYTRAMHTAAIISKELGIDINVEFDLREWQPDLSFQFDSYERLKELIDDYEKYNGIYSEGENKLWESKEALKKRIDTVLEKYLNYSRVIVVGHGEIFKTQKDIKDIPHCSIIEIER